jgi:hypothetical protein
MRASNSLRLPRGGFMEIASFGLSLDIGSHGSREREGCLSTSKREWSRSIEHSINIKSLIQTPDDVMTVSYILSRLDILWPVCADVWRQTRDASCY